MTNNLYRLQRRYRVERVFSPLTASIKELSVKTQAKTEPRSSGRLQASKTLDDRSGQRGARFRFYERDIAAVEVAIDRHVLAEIGIRYRLTRLRFRLRDVARIHDAVRGGVADENAHAHSDVAGTRA